MNPLLKYYWNLVFSLTGKDVAPEGIYRQFAYCSLACRADARAVQEMLASPRFIPLESAPGACDLHFLSCNMQDVDPVGPYLEMGVQVPVEPLEASPGTKFVHLLLPVTSEDACWPGVDIYGFPKFIANIEIEDKGYEITSRLSSNGQDILQFTVPTAKGLKQPDAWQLYGLRKSQIVKSRFDYTGTISTTVGPRGSALRLGDHPLGQKLQRLLLSGEILSSTTGRNCTGTLGRPVPLAKTHEVPTVAEFP